MLGVKLQVFLLPYCGEPSRNGEVNPFKPELLAPAGSLEKLKVAINYGADAVYLGGHQFNLRSAADNFTFDELKEGIEYCHENQAKAYIVLNNFMHDKDLESLPTFLRQLDEAGADALIISDLGVIQTVRTCVDIPIHLSTQASCINSWSAQFWKKMGVKRVILGRECSVEEAGAIKRKTGLEVEMFIHGSLCMAYSGHCTISNFTAGRDSNRGGCAHSCRFEYELDFSQEQKKKVFFMSSKDLEGLSVLPDFFKHEIDSVKVEGRMKSQIYVGTLSKVYSEAIHYFDKHKDFPLNKLESWQKELKKITHRDYTQASLLSPAKADSIYWDRDGENKHYVVVGQLVEVDPGKHAVIQVKNAFEPGDKLELLTYEGDAIEVELKTIENLLGHDVQKTNPGMLAMLPFVEGMQEGLMARKAISNREDLS